MSSGSVFYNRAPSKELLNLLKPGGFLEPVIKLNKRDYKDLKLDVHFRVGEEVHVYYGLTAILIVKRLQNQRDHITVKAHETYTRQTLLQDMGLFRRWPVGESGLSKTIEDYLAVAEVNTSFIEKEGAVQALWAGVDSPWTPFDREANLAYESEGHRTAFKDFPKVRAALEMFKDINSSDNSQLAKPPELKARNKADQLAVDHCGNLVLLELKDASANSASSVYYSPYQLLQYVWEWDKALKASNILGDLNRLVGARKRLGLTPPSVPELNGSIRAAVGFGSSVSLRPGKFESLSERFKKHKKVLDIVNCYLPKGVAPIETWAFKDGKPYPM